MQPEQSLARRRCQRQSHTVLAASWPWAKINFWDISPLRLVPVWGPGMPRLVSRSLAMLFACAAAWPAAAADLTEQDAAAVLAQHGLARLDRVWVACRRSAAAARPGRIAQAPRADSGRRTRPGRADREQSQALAGVRSRRSPRSASRCRGSASDDPQRLLLAQQIDALAAAAAEPAKLGARGEVRTRVLRLDRRTQRPGDRPDADSRCTIGRPGRASTSGWHKRPAFPRPSAAPATSTASARSAATPRDREQLERIREAGLHALGAGVLAGHPAPRDGASSTTRRR